ncbi:Tex family protein [Elstera cyanobacteriorum]|uniref:Tex family protein n=1 Tax=Elstera cyanobacteriorum TaxID=2022747 RepID=UPI00235466D5|nr:Tex family protein [Elstera cyanobacteriorum]MCK6442214.1 RNA-binding transcriptional accessory protein [Elstera cyanobacteriorum]
MGLSIDQRLAAELAVRVEQVAATVALLDGGSTVPFIARYRKEATGGLDDIQLRTLEERLRYLRELDERREAVIASVREQGKLTDELLGQFTLADTKARLEDLYLPYKPKRRTKAQIAKEAGLEPLADLLLANPTRTPETEAAAFVDAEKGVADGKAALEGAKQILIERFAEDAELVGSLRSFLWDNGVIRAKAIVGKEEAGAKFSDYFDYAEPIKQIPSHRALALFRGRKEEVLTVTLGLAEEPAPGQMGPCEARIAAHVGIAAQGRPADAWLLDVARWCWRVKVSVHLELDLMNRLFEGAEDEAIRVFAGNLRDLLLAAPAGMRPTLALDPGFRTGTKVAVVDATGKLLDTATIYPHEPQRRYEEAINLVAALCQKHDVQLIAIGNGTASRETDRFAADLLSRFPALKATKVMVSEAGASVYSASAFASQEFPSIDVSIRGAISIGRRLQDPLAELVKIDPKSIGVGQYQHDISETKLSRALDAVVEDCVNGVGVDLNTASVPLLTRVSGLNETLARNIVAWRDAQGAFRNRNQLKEIARLGPKAFEQAAGFLRIRGGDEPLDASAVHPEAYPVVRKIAQTVAKPVTELIGDSATLRGLNPASFADDRFGLPTVQDILRELDKPGRDPRPEFKTATFKEGVEELKDLQPGMLLEGVVTNVAAFGAFVDIGVHQDGLVHVSALASRFVKDPREVVKPGQVVRVKVLEVDLKRKRVGLTMRLDDPADGSAAPRSAAPRAAGPRDPAPRSGTPARAGGGKPAPQPAAGGGALAAALLKAGLNKR